MINKINPAPTLQLVTAQPKHSENDPGSSQGNGMAYQRPDKKEENGEQEVTPPASSSPSEVSTAEAETNSDPAKKSKKTKGAKLKLIKGGLNEIYEELFKKKKEQPHTAITTQYSAEDTTPAKGMLVNKKAE